MRAMYIKGPACALVIAFGFGGCAETQDGRTTQAQGTGIGALGGAALGGLIGYAAGGGQGAAIGAGIGAATGGVAGFAYGTHVANKKARYASAEQWLDACIVQAQEENKRAYATNRNLNRKLANLEARAKAARIANNRAEMGRIKRELAQMKGEAQKASNSVAGELKTQQTVLSDGDARASGKHKALRGEVSQLKKTQGQLGATVDRIASLQNSIDA